MHVFCVLKSWRAFSLWLLLCALAGAVHAQTCAMPGRDGNIPTAGVINTYYPPATGTFNAASTSIGLGTRVGSTTDVAPGDLVVVMQMQCATLNTTNTTNYGAGNGTGRGYTDPAGSCLAGRYEYVRAGPGTTAASLDLRGSLLTGVYVQDLSTATNRRTFQVIRVPQYASFALGGTVNAPYWNGATGGVVVIDAAGQLNWNGQTIDVAGRGFRGGAAVFWPGTEDIDTPPDHVATLASNQHSTKGEGIAGTPRFVRNQETNARVDNTIEGYPSGDTGRGAPGNAGGGGDNRSGTRDNGGGGGGGNGGIGGYGGYGWKSGGWGGTFTVADFDLRGIGGAAFASPASNRVVMGGGGGAGATNNGGNPPVNSDGGAGGGIVIARAGSMIGSGTILATGAAGQTNTGNDAAGGGGAGGSVVLMSQDSSMGAPVVNVSGGAGGNSFLPGTTAHGGGGGGGAGVVITRSAVSATANGGPNGTTNTGDNPVGGAANGANTGGSSTAGTSADAVFTVRPGAQCLPVLSVTKTTLTPTVTTAAATSVSYTIVVSNSGGAAIGADLVDNALPPGWTLSQTSGIAFAPALSASAWGGFVEGATPGLPAVAGSPGTVANLSVGGTTNSPTWSNLTIPGGTVVSPGRVTLSFVVSVPASAPVGCFHNPAGVKYLDPTRSTAGREIAPATNNTANRAGAAVGGITNTTYETNPGTSTVVVGSQHSGLVAGPASDDVCLQGDLSITKSAPVSVTAGQTLTYTLQPRNNGRAIRDLTFAADQASDAANANAGTRVLANGVVRVTDTLPAGLVITSAIAPTGWTCGLSGQTVSCDSAVALPIAASTNLNAITGTVRVSNSACPGPLVNTAAVAGFQSPYADSTLANGTSTVSTSLVCSGTLTVAKDNGGNAVTTGTTTTYTVTVANQGPASADGAVVSDTPDAGLSSCSVVSCSASGGNPVAACPATPANLLNPSGVALPSLPSGGTVVFGVRCTVTASGV